MPPGTASHEAVDSFTDESPGHLGVLLEALSDGILDESVIILVDEELVPQFRARTLGYGRFSAAVLEVDLSNDSNRSLERLLLEGLEGIGAASTFSFIALYMNEILS